MLQISRRQFVHFVSFLWALPVSTKAVFSASDDLAVLKKAPFDTLHFTTHLSGLRLADIAVGKGSTPSPGDICVVDYTGYLSNGEIFDSSKAKGRRPIAFRYGKGQVIPGWEIGLEDMRPNGRRILVIPPSLAYGHKGVCLEGRGCFIPPDETLVFDVSLLRVAPSPS
eukprot:jgi/Galph1/640/GphlegSOOS_G5437.1